MIVFLIGAIGVTQYSSEASVLGAFRNSTEGTDGYDTLKAAFPEGALGPANVIIDRQDGPITDADIEAARSAMQSVPEVATVTAVTGKSEDGKAAVFQVAFKDDPYGNPALDRTQTMRDKLATLDPQIKAYVGGVSAIQRDYRDGAQHDLDLIVPLVLIMILLTLIALLRAIVAPLYLIGSVILSFFGILGVCLVFFTQVMDETGFDPSFPIFAFIFLVALGVDYNIFLMDRVREEARKIGTVRGGAAGVGVDRPGHHQRGHHPRRDVRGAGDAPDHGARRARHRRRVRRARRHVHRAVDARAGDHHRGRRRELVAVEAQPRGRGGSGRARGRRRGPAGRARVTLISPTSGAT